MRYTLSIKAEPAVPISPVSTEVSIIAVGKILRTPKRLIAKPDGICTTAYAQRKRLKSAPASTFVIGELLADERQGEADVGAISGSDRIDEKNQPATTQRKCVRPDERALRGAPVVAEVVMLSPWIRYAGIHGPVGGIRTAWRIPCAAW